MNNMSINTRRAAFLVLLGFVVMFLSSSIKGVYQVYFTDIAAHFGAKRGEFALSGSIFVLVTGLVSPLVGGLSDKYGPLKTVLAGSVVAGIAFVAMAVFSHQFWVFSIFYGVLGAFALAAMTYVPMGIMVDRLFEQKSKGFAFAIVTNGTSFGFILLSPLWIWIQPQMPWTTVFLIVGLIFLIPISLSLAVASTVPIRAPSSADTSAPGTWRAVLSDSRFYILAASFVSCGATMAFIDVHIVPHWQDIGASRTNMGASLSTLGILELISGLAAGWLATRYSKNWLLCGFYFVRTAAMLALLTDSQFAGTYLFAVLFGISYLGTVVLTSAYCFDFYGAKIKGQVFGGLFLVHQIGAFLAVQLGAIGYDMTQSYQPVIVGLAVATAFAGMISMAFLPGLPRGERPSIA